MESTTHSGEAGEKKTLAKGMLQPWTVGELPESPARGWKRWLSVIGPGVLLAGASIGTGEWLFGPAVTAQYGATMMWLATLSIACQVFLNIEMLRYTIYCGEPIVVGFFRSFPGPRLWTFCYAALDFAAIWPFNVANAAVIMTAGILGHLPGDGSVTLLGSTVSEQALVRIVSFALFYLAFLPLIFGGTIYKMLLRIFTFKLVLTLVYLSFCAIFMVSSNNRREVVSGFFRFGQVPLRARTVIVDRHFTLAEKSGNLEFVIRGTREHDKLLVTEFRVRADGKATTTTGHEARADKLKERAGSLLIPGRFYVEDETEDTGPVTVSGVIRPDRSWQPESITWSDSAGRHTVGSISEVPDRLRSHVDALVERQGLVEVGLFSYWREHGHLPRLDWAILAAFTAIAGAGGLSNTLFSSFARDKGWGMGAHVGAIPSLIGGRAISLSHVGEVFEVTEKSRPRWRGWMRYVTEDQIVVWMLCSFLGMALPCMISLEFIRHAPIAGERVAAMTAEGMAARYPAFSQGLWLLTLTVGFLVLFPGQILSGDIIARRWTDIIWTTNPQAQGLKGNQVKYVYYSILALYALWGTVALGYFNPLQVATIGGVLMNVAMAFSAFHTLYVNCTLLPRKLRPNLVMQAGVIACGLFFTLISVIVVVTLFQR